MAGGGEADKYTPPHWACPPRSSGSVFLDALKSGTLVDSHAIDNNAHVVLGRSPQIADIVLDHASIRHVRQHAALVHKRDGGVALIDLNSAHGTFVDGTRIEPDTAVDLNTKCTITFGASTREYRLRREEPIRKNTSGGPRLPLSTEDKKKLLWGSKKQAAAASTEPADEVPGNSRWDSVQFDDPERSMKFKKLMGIKASSSSHPTAAGPSSSTLKKEAAAPLRPDKQRQVSQELEEQFVSGLRRKDGRTVGLGR
eukprot:jgi/Chlat1/1882/Chrsp145S02202